MVTDTGYLKVYTYEKWSDNKIPVFQVGDQFYVKRLQMNDGRTSAPTPLSEVELITQMDQNGIGTDATVATHIKTIQDREYATKDPQVGFANYSMIVICSYCYSKYDIVHFLSVLQHVVYPRFILLAMIESFHSNEIGRGYGGRIRKYGIDSLQALSSRRHGTRLPKNCT